MIKKEDILREIRKQAEANDGVPLGKERFEEATGVKQSAWQGRYWVRWSEAIAEAGFTPNKWQRKKLTDEELIREFAILAQQLGYYPVVAEVRLHSIQNPSFPTHTTFSNRFGGRSEQLQVLMRFSEHDPDFHDVYLMCTSLVKSEQVKVVTEIRRASVPGRVYMIYSNSLKLYKIGQSDDLKRRYQEIQSDVPGKLDEIHVLETDDPAGIERYWHRRFKHHKKINEWFELTANDVEAFKRRGKSM